MAAEKFIGRWNSASSENFEEYMKECGVGLLTRKAAANIKVTLEFKKQGNKWVCAQESTFKNTSLEFELDKEFEETTPDGRKYLTLVTITPEGKFIQRQKKIKDGDKDSTITRHVDDNDILNVVMECGSIVCKRTYTRQK
ncbi:lbp-6 [Pristionchus pacificus]|uniref:Lbp-6 n=1 Tax=Pristionchus pacificus TaxID=54126 RepID=A0A454Y582_PRIPA|nr:lbp-6 [Pristionchus pacificus]|eukprot:PDM74886.1 lbp-6 [Pristionchus pacificus]